MKRVSTMKCLGLAGLCGATVLSLGCSNENKLSEMSANRGDVQYSASTGKMFRTFEYFPSAEVYYSVFQDSYFWNDGMNWHRTTSLPSHYEGQLDDSVLIQLPTDAPHLMHDQVVSSYPSVTNLRRTLAVMDAENNRSETWTNDDWNAIVNVATEY